MPYGCTPYKNGNQASSAHGTSMTVTVRQKILILNDLHNYIKKGN